jgi:hypothetical protein
MKRPTGKRKPIRFLPPSPPDNDTETERLLRAILETLKSIRAILLRNEGVG